MDSWDSGGQPADASRSGDGALRWENFGISRPYSPPAGEIEDTPEELQAFQDFQPFLEDNPRELKRLVNIHRFVKILLQPTEASATPETQDQRKLVKWLFFCARWPDLIDDAMRQAAASPETTDILTTTIERDEALSKQPGFNADEISRFAGHATREDMISGADLSPDSPLARAAFVSQLVIDSTVYASSGEAG